MASTPKVSLSKKAPARRPSDAIDLAVVAGLVQGRRIDAQGLQQAVGDRAVGERTVDLQGAAVHQVQLAAEVVLVALGVAAEIVVVVEDQDARAGPRGAVEVRRRQAADAAADDDQVVGLAGVLGRRWPRSRSRRRASLWAFSKLPGWEPRMPVSTGG